LLIDGISTLNALPMYGFCGVTALEFHTVGNFNSCHFSSNPASK
jgi:hypothetical protein